MSDLAEPEWVIDTIATRTGHPRDLVESVVSDVRFAIDDLFADDVSLFLTGMVFMRRGDPVATRLWALLEDPNGALPENLYKLEPSELATLLGLDLSLVERFPVAWAGDVLLAVMRLRDSDDADEATILVFADIIDEWLDTFIRPHAGRVRPLYEVSPVGLERHFEDWLVGRLAVLAPVGYSVELHGRQVHFRGAGFADLVCRVTVDEGVLRRGDWLIIENKAVVAGSAALAQVRRYVAAARVTHARGSERVFGLLLADGSTVELSDLLRAEPEPDVDYVSLAAIGYRRHLRDAAIVVREVEDDPLRSLTVVTERIDAVAGDGLSAKDQAARRPTGP